MRILVALSRFPYPTYKGDRLRAFYQIKELSAAHEVHVVCVAESEPSAADYAAVSAYCKSLTVVRLTPFQKYLNLFRALWDKKPFQVHYFRVPALPAIIELLVAKHHIEVSLVQLIRMAVNMPKNAKPAQVLDYMDAFSVNMSRRAALSPFYFKPIVALEARRLRNYETKVATDYQGLCIISTDDQAQFEKSLQERIVVISNGVDESFFSYDDKAITLSSAGHLPAIPQAIDLIFTGNMQYFPNVQAARYIIEQLMPVLLTEFPQLQLYIVGIDPDPVLLRLGNDHIHLTGYVPDVRPYLHRAKVFVAPLFSGSGLQNKLLEAMAMGVPVVTTWQANRALGAAACDAILLAESAEQFIAHIRNLLTDAAMANSIGQAGRTHVQAHFSWKNASQQLVQLCTAAIHAKP
jgi:polysaccharide biosynthesis protein PslH